MEYTKTTLPICLSVRTLTTLLRVDFSTYPPSGGESHSMAEVKYIERGTHVTLLDGVRYTIEEGQMLLYAPFAYHDFACKNNTLAGIIAFETDSPEFAELYNRVITLTARQRQMITRILDIGEDMLKIVSPEEGVVGMVPKDDIDPLELQKLKNQLELFFLDVYLSLKNGSTNQKIYRADQFDMLVGYMRSRVREDISLNDISKACSMSVSKVKLIFKEQCGVSPIAYFISLKIDEAKRLIAETPMNFTQISEYLGFTSAHYFSKLFKKKTGMTPSEYSKSLSK